MEVGAETWACSDLMERTWVTVALGAGRQTQKQLVSLSLFISGVAMGAHLQMSPLEHLPSHLKGEIL